MYLLYEVTTLDLCEYTHTSKRLTARRILSTSPSHSLRTGSPMAPRLGAGCLRGRQQKNKSEKSAP